MARMIPTSKNANPYLAKCRFEMVTMARSDLDLKHEDTHVHLSRVYWIGDALVLERELREIPEPSLRSLIIDGITANRKTSLVIYSRGGKPCRFYRLVYASIAEYLPFIELDSDKAGMAEERLTLSKAELTETDSL